MERESFEDEEVASLLNKHYVSIKVDREERPDLDHIYMNVCQRMTGQGGWPLTVLITPDKKPFFAGTYYPKYSKYGRPGMMDILSQIAEKWEKEQVKIIETAEKVVQAVQIQDQVVAPKDGAISMKVMDEAFSIYRESFDGVYGGFGEAPKFPSPHNLYFLLRYYKVTDDKQAMHMVETTLDAMCRGGIYDHLGYGFSRYSVDREWLVPHFEKMLYDNALLAIAYLEAYQLTGNPLYKRIPEEIYTYIERDMTSPEGGFYCAEDADSEGIEGKFYVWTLEEIKQILGDKEGELFCDYYDVTKSGNFEGENILNLIHQDPQKFLAGMKITEEEWDQRLAQMRDKLFVEREKRIHPHKDDKILTSWNGLMVAALAIGARVLRDKKWEQMAKRAVHFMMDKLVREDGRLLARYRDGHADFLGYLDDYAFLIWGLIELYEVTLESQYLSKAIQLNEDMMRLFWDQENNGLFFNGEDAESLITRPKEVYDGAMPSGNSVAALNLLRLARLTGKAELESLAERQLETFAGLVTHYPPGYSYFLTAMLFAICPPTEIVLVGDPMDKGMKEMMKTLHQQFLPFAVILLKQPGDSELEQLAPYIAEHHAIDGKATAYICHDFSCQAPTINVINLENLGSSSVV
ncbi:MAG TPA: thioredoxin domain-containing protein [Bacillota bacterium]|nr:thioredoxin domain-containing protein [Bacillota bacterium]